MYVDAQDHMLIKDLNIRDNTKDKIRFTKLPWWQWAFAAVFLAAAVLPLWIVDHNQLSGHKFNVAACMFCLLVSFALLFVYEGKIERVTFNRVK